MSIFNQQKPLGFLNYAFSFKKGFVLLGFQYVWYKNPDSGSSKRDRLRQNCLLKEFFGQFRVKCLQFFVNLDYLRLLAIRPQNET